MKCVACSTPLKQPLVAVSHTIKPGSLLCPECGQRESVDPLWADGMRIGFERDAAARKVIGVTKGSE